MRVIKSDSGFYAFQKIFRHIASRSSTVVVWQVLPGGNRSIGDCTLNSFHLESGLLHFSYPQEIRLQEDLPVYFYAEEGQFIFKSKIQDSSKGSVFTVNVPTEVKLLEDPDVTFIKGSSGVDLSEIWKVKRLKMDEPKAMSERSARDQKFLDIEFGADVTLDEEDKLFADKRTSPRARPQGEKFVKVSCDANNEEHILKLHDLSRGGIGFISLEPDKFPKGSIVRVLGFEEFDLDDPLIARVMSQRPVDELGIEFKIGCKFDEGQS